MFRPGRARRTTSGAALAVAAVAVPLLSACTGPLSTLDAAGSGAQRIAGLFIVMATVATAVWLFVAGAAVYAARKTPQDNGVRAGHKLIVFGGILLPLLLLGALSYSGLRQANELLEPGDGLVISVTGERWWWRVRYAAPSAPAVVSANEIRMPLGERVEFRLASTDVIHSFWIPSLGGKTDMIPGRLNRLVLEATREGRFRGACAEFCGLSHALMEFDVVVMSPGGFREWLEHQASDARAPSDRVATRGQQLFMQNGCGACHRIGGTSAEGRIGPDLTHVGGRHSIAAGTLPVEPDAIAAWISHPSAVKPGALMPPFSMLGADDLRAIGAYLEGLE